MLPLWTLLESILEAARRSSWSWEHVPNKGLCHSTAQGVLSREAANTSYNLGQHAQWEWEDAESHAHCES